MADYTRQVHFRCTIGEYEKAQKNAQRANLSVSLYARKMMVDGNVKAPVVSPEVGKVVFSQLGRIGGNINQIARAINSGNLQTDADTEMLLKKIIAGYDALFDFLLDGKKSKMKKYVSKTEIENLEARGQETLFEEPTEPAEPADPAEDGLKKEVGRTERTCPDCGGKLILRHGRNGDFYGCENYPRCKHSESI